MCRPDSRKKGPQAELTRAGIAAANFPLREVRDSAAGSDCPAFTIRGESDTFVVLVVKRFPARTVVLGKLEPDVPTATRQSFAHATAERNQNGLSMRVHALPPTVVIAEVAAETLGLR